MRCLQIFGKIDFAKQQITLSVEQTKSQELESGEMETEMYKEQQA